LAAGQIDSCRGREAHSLRDGIRVLWSWEDRPQGAAATTQRAFGLYGTNGEGGAQPIELDAAREAAVEKLVGPLAAFGEGSASPEGRLAILRDFASMTAQKIARSA
jgi:hypothetical protein